MSQQALKFGRAAAWMRAFALVVSFLAAGSGQGVTGTVSDGVPLTAASRSPTEPVYRIVSPLGERIVTMMPRWPPGWTRSPARRCAWCGTTPSRPT